MCKCGYCGGTGIISEPVDQGEFNVWYKKYLAMGQLSANSCRYFAGLKVKKTSIECPYCNKLI